MTNPTTPTAAETLDGVRGLIQSEARWQQELSLRQGLCAEYIVERLLVLDRCIADRIAYLRTSAAETNQILNETGHPVESVGRVRLNPEVRAELIEFARTRIQMRLG
ncbi:hypothetical protein ATY41_10780 [Leifsonia xyli subsp. xyli]|uniref:Uncharacterized protein n=1 Tax=Leifsonia xyli subsp. xyli TaxID=59736 RepID=A0A1E2SK54_LEIXY|nr:hypothetical protein [Leifsonia xyli]ODA90236.1 hypothetical protein ATY41_10780 [Leifsonia xyli subsp. xyli]